MPCWTRQYTSVKLRAEVYDDIEAALKADQRFRDVRRDGAGRIVGISTKEGAFFIEKDGTLKSYANTEAIGSQVNTAYSVFTVKKQAKKMGWTVRQTGPFSFQATKN